GADRQRAAALPQRGASAARRWALFAAALWAAFGSGGLSRAPGRRNEIGLCGGLGGSRARGLGSSADPRGWRGPPARRSRSRLERMVAGQIGIDHVPLARRLGSRGGGQRRRARRLMRRKARFRRLGGCRARAGTRIGLDPGEAIYQAFQGIVHGFERVVRAVVDLLLAR